MLYFLPKKQEKVLNDLSKRWNKSKKEVLYMAIEYLIARHYPNHNDEQYEIPEYMQFEFERVYKELKTEKGKNSDKFPYDTIISLVNEHFWELL